MNDRIRLDVNHMMNDYLGGQGIERDELSAFAHRAKEAFEKVETNRGKGMQGWMDSPYDKGNVVRRINESAKHIRQHFESFVVLGIGGSALGPLAVQQALNHLHYNELSDQKRNGPRLYVEDNIDPERMCALLDVIDIKKTCFNVITKSGGTAETMSQYLIVLEHLKNAVGDDYRKHIIITTSESKGFLINVAKEEGYETFYIPDGVGGRFSELCPVGLLPACVCGIDIQMLLDGARDMDERCKASDDIMTNPALLDASLMYLAMTKHNANISVMFPYADSLKLIADWYAQLWAESLGKNITLDGKPCNVGQTPVKALGVTDQHSQLQLYTEGPYDKVITFLKVEEFRDKTTIPHGCNDIPPIAFLGGKSHNQLIEAERAGTEYALYMAHRMNQTITLPKVNEFTIGQLLYFFQMVTAYTGAMLNIDAFNQPGVEESKLAAYAVMGYDSDAHKAKRDEMKMRPERKVEYLI